MTTQPLSINKRLVRLRYLACDPKARRPGIKEAQVLFEALRDPDVLVQDYLHHSGVLRAMESRRGGLLRWQLTHLVRWHRFDAQALGEAVFDLEPGLGVGLWICDGREGVTLSGAERTVTLARTLVGRHAVILLVGEGWRRDGTFRPEGWRYNPKETVARLEHLVSVTRRYSAKTDEKGKEAPHA